MQIKISSGERAELIVPSNASAAIHVATEASVEDRTRPLPYLVCEIIVENGLVTKVAVRERDGSWTLVATREAH